MEQEGLTTMQRRIFIGGLAAVAAILPFRRARARVRLQRAFDQATRDYCAWYETHRLFPPRDRAAYDATLARWKISMAELNAAAPAAGLIADQYQRLRTVMLWTPPTGLECDIHAHTVNDAKKAVPFLHIPAATERVVSGAYG